MYIECSHYRGFAEFSVLRMRLGNVKMYWVQSALLCCLICNLYQLVSFQLVIGLFQQVSLVLVSYKTLEFRNNSLVSVLV